MRSLLLGSSAFALALGAASARAEDVEYPTQSVVFATAIDPTPIVTSDVTYDAPHAVILKEGPGPGRAFVASHEDVRYESGITAGKTAPARDERARCLVAQASTCPHHG